MARSTIVRCLSLILAAWMLAAGLPALAQEPPLAGHWLGGFALGDAWTFATVTFTDEGGYLFPDDSDWPFALRDVRVERGRVQWELVREGDRLLFDGPLAEGVLAGQVSGENASGSFYLAQPAQITPAAYDLAIGNYTREEGRAMLLARSDGTQQLFYLDAGLQVPLFPIAGGRFLSAVGEELTLTYDDDGNVSGLALRRVFGSNPSPHLLPHVELYDQQEVRFASGDARLSGTLLLPLGEGPHPAVILLHGAGASERALYRVYADHLARHGVAALIYDQRGSGDSTGNVAQTTAEPSAEDLVADALAGLHLLAAHPQIDGTRCGIWGISQGGRLAPLVAVRSPEVAFIVALSAPGMSLSALELWQWDRRYRLAGYPDPFRDAPLQVVRIMQDGERLLRRPDRLFADRDTAADWAQVAQPVLLLYGANDGLVPPEQSAARIARALESAPSAGEKADYTAVIFPGADHNLLAPTGEGYWGPAPGVLETMTDWLTQHVDERDDLPIRSKRMFTPQPTGAFERGGRFGPSRWYQGLIPQALLGLGLLALWVVLITGQYPPHQLRAIRAACGLGLLALAAWGGFLWLTAQPLIAGETPGYAPTSPTQTLALVAALAALGMLALPVLIGRAGRHAPSWGARTAYLLVSLLATGGLGWLLIYWGVWATAREQLFFLLAYLPVPAAAVVEQIALVVG